MKHTVYQRLGAGNITKIHKTEYDSTTGLIHDCGAVSEADAQREILHGTEIGRLGVINLTAINMRALAEPTLLSNIISVASAHSDLLGNRAMLSALASSILHPGHYFIAMDSDPRHHMATGENYVVKRCDHSTELTLAHANYLVDHDVYACEYRPSSIFLNGRFLKKMGHHHPAEAAAFINKYYRNVLAA
jgi:hypothetical protein